MAETKQEIPKLKLWTPFKHLLPNFQELNHKNCHFLTDKTNLNECDNLSRAHNAKNSFETRYVLRLESRN
ncbi:MAG: hypothetical protein B6247_28435 [Candidatus Parabeggiatoa sp. nov. 2]|nr:MAG: hypothetical protein B6247_28435 [Beggiatoa sp. 4572_84]